MTQAVRKIPVQYAKRIVEPPHVRRGEHAHPAAREQRQA
mgnify:CR=1 FL=1